MRARDGGERGERKKETRAREGFTAAGLRRLVIMLRRIVDEREAFLGAARRDATSSSRLRNASLYDASSPPFRRRAEYVYRIATESEF